MFAALAPAKLQQGPYPSLKSGIIIYEFVMSLRNDIINAANRYGVPPDIAISVAMQESGIRQYDRSGGVLRGAAGEFGIFQLMPGTAADLSVDPTNPQANIDGGVRYLAEQFGRFGNWTSALVAYNAGPGNVQRGTAPARSFTYASQVLARAPSTLRLTELPGGISLPPPPDLPYQPGGGTIPLFTANVFGKESHTALFVVLGLLGALAVSEAT